MQVLELNHVQSRKHVHTKRDVFPCAGLIADVTEWLFEIFGTILVRVLACALCATQISLCTSVERRATSAIHGHLGVKRESIEELRDAASVCASRSLRESDPT
jgi:hypothetical protein